MKMPIDITTVPTNKKQPIKNCVVDGNDSLDDPFYYHSLLQLGMTVQLIVANGILGTRRLQNLVKFISS